MVLDNVRVIFGPNGSGKTRYVEHLRRQLSSGSVRYIAFCDSYGAQTDRAYYLQQRWNQHDIDEETPTVLQSLLRSMALAGLSVPAGDGVRQLGADVSGLVERLGLTASLDKYVIQLSSGELRKLQLVKTLLSHPRTLIIDNPFIGLDSPTRQQLKELLRRLAAEGGMRLYLVVARRSDIPEYGVVERDFSGGAGEAEATEATGTTETTEASVDAPVALPSPRGRGGGGASGNPVVELRHVSIRYGERTILNDVCWTIRRGEHWALSGPNGSGKSTLISLICADNPQGYACDISLFGRRRGSGETVWDIKRRIGYVSPEMHRSYQRSLPALQVVASGLKDTVGLYTRPDAEERERCLQALGRFGVAAMGQRPFLSLSSGEQRLVLLARAFVKDPDLLILDEPLHGLDDRNSARVKAIIDDYCSRPEKTLIMVSHYEEELPTCIDRRMTL